MPRRGSASMLSMSALSWYSCRLLAPARASIIRGSVACEFTPSSCDLPARSALSGGHGAGVVSLCFVAPGDVPRQQLVDAVDGMLGNAREHLAQVGLRIEPVELGRLHQTVDRRRSLAARVRTHEQVVASAKCNSAQGAFGGVVVDLDAAVVDVAR